MRNILVVLSLCLLACDSPGSDSGTGVAVSCDDAIAAICERLAAFEADDTCPSITFAPEPMNPRASWSGATACWQHLACPEEPDGTDWGACARIARTLSCHGHISTMTDACGPAFTQ